MRPELASDYLFYDLRNKRDIRNSSVVVIWIVLVHPLVLDNMDQYRTLLGRGKSTFTDGVVAEDGGGGGEWKKDVNKLLQHGCKKTSSSQYFEKEVKMIRPRSVAGP